MMGIALGAIPSGHFPPTPYERLLTTYRRTTDVDLIPVFDVIQKEFGGEIDEYSLLRELTNRADFSAYLAVAKEMHSRDEDFQELVIAEATAFWFAFHHYVSGERVFRIHSELAKALNDTELRVPAAYLALPFDGLCLSYEGDILTVKAPPERGIPDEALNAIYMTGHTGRFKELSIGPNPRRFMVYAKAPMETSSEHEPLAFFSGLPSMGEGAEVVDEGFIDRSLREKAADARLEIQKLALKTIAYINSAGADALERPSSTAEIEAFINDPRTSPPREERRKLERKAARSSRLPYIYVGSRLPRAREESISVPGPGVHKLTYRFTVRGHFHGFWKLKRNLRPDEMSWIRQEETDEKGHVWTLVVKWVHPYEKGPEEAEKIHRRYYVQGIT